MRFPRLAKHRQVQLETDELALQHLGLIAKAYREKLHGEDTPRTRARTGMALSFEELEVGMRVQVMDDLLIVSAACAVDTVGWREEMQTAVGEEFAVVSTSTALKSAELATSGKFGMEINFFFPCTVLLRGEACLSDELW